MLIKIGDHALKASTFEYGRGKEDVKDFESFVFVKMARRGVCLNKLPQAFYEKLHKVIARAAEQNPTRFRYFLLAAPRFSDQEVTDTFTVLRDAPQGFPSYVQSKVRFFPWPKSDSPGKVDESAEQISEAMIQQYRLWELHCGLFCPGRGLVGDPNGNSVDFKGDGTPWDLKGLMEGSAWDAGAATK